MDRPFVITWASSRGPMCRRFACAVAFDGYLRAFKTHTGQRLEWDGPRICKGAL